MNKKTLTILTCLAGLAFPASAQQTKILTAEKHNEYGLVYSLPVTALEIKVTATRRVERKGPFFQYAKKYLGSEKVITTDRENWTIQRVEVQPYGVADTESQYLMQLKPGALTYISVAPDGMLLGINREVPCPAAPGSSSGEIENPGKPDFGKSYLEFVGEDFIASQSTAKQAELLAENLLEIRDSKNSLTRGTADVMPTDGKQMELMLASLNEQEKAMTAAFNGNIWTQTITRTFNLIPQDAGKSVIFRLSDFAGFVDSDDLSGDPVELTVEITSEGTLPTDSKGDEKKFPKDGIAYCIPGSAQITVSTLGKTLFEKEFDFAQFGTRFGLNPALFTDRKDPSWATFNPATGGLEQMGTGIQEVVKE